MANKKWQKSHAEKDQAKFLSHIPRISKPSHALKNSERLCKAHAKPQPKQDEYNDTGRDKATVTKQLRGYVTCSYEKIYKWYGTCFSDNVLMSDVKDKVNTFIQYVSMFNREGDIPTNGSSPHHAMENLNISQAGVTKLLKGSNTNKASKPDKISPNVLNELEEDTVLTSPPYSPHRYISGRIPDQWKTNLASRIFKKALRQKNAANYRPTIDQ